MSNAILSLPDEQPAGISLTALTSEPMAVLCPLAHRLAGRKSVRLSELGEEPFIDHPVGWGTRMSVQRTFSAAGLRRRVAFEVGDTPSVVNLVRHGLGVAVLPRSIVYEHEGVRFVPIRGRAPLWEVSLALPSNRPASAAARAFVDALAGSAQPTRPADPPSRWASAEVGDQIGDRVDDP
jgi:DNA-binding transcriptional LysR family regulator